MVTKAIKMKENLVVLIKNPRNWIYLFLFYLITGYGFYKVVLEQGSSNPAGIANYSIISLFFFIPLLSTGNTISADEKKSAAAVLGSAWSMVIVFCIGLLIYIPFGAVIAAGGTFRIGLFLNAVCNILLAGLAVISISLFIVQIFRKRFLAYVCMYGLAVLVVAIELVLGVLQPSQTVYQILYAVSLSKYCFGLSIGILDLKAALFFICISVFFTLLAIRKVNRRVSGTAGLTGRKIQTAAAALLGISILYVVSTPDGSRYGIDMTPVKLFTPGSYAMSYIEAVQQEITITVFDSREGFIDKNLYSAYFVQAQRILEGFDKNSDHITVEYQDIQEYPEVLSEYDIEEPGRGDILVRCGSRYQLIKSESLFNFSYPADEAGNTYMQIVSSKAEQEICSAMESVLAEESNQVVFLLGNEEHDNYKELAALLTKQGYEVLYTDIYEDEIPDARMAVIFAPSQDYMDTVKIQEFLYNEAGYGRSLLYVANSDPNILQGNLDALLEKWGLEVENYNVMETAESNFTREDPMYGENEYTNHSFIPDISYMEKPVVVPYSRNITVDESDTSLYYRVLLQSKESSTLVHGNSYYEDYGNHYTAVISSYYQTNAFGNSYTGISGHVGVIGSEAAFSPDVLVDQQYSNSAYFADVMDELFGKNEIKIPIAEKSLTIGAYSSTESVRIVFMILFVAVFPMIMLVTGIVLYASNKKHCFPHAKREIRHYV